MKKMVLSISSTALAKMQVHTLAKKTARISAPKHSCATTLYRTTRRATAMTLVLLLSLALVTGCGANGVLHSYPAVPAPAAHPAPAAPAEAPASAPEFWPLEDAEYSLAPDLDPEGNWRNAPIDETDEFSTAVESPFMDVRTSPLSTFSASVNTASYSIMRRQINSNMEPAGLRIEELINYFDFNYPAPKPGSEHPFSIITEVAQCPWAPGHMLAKIAVQGVRLEHTEEIANNIVFLIDVSGSMDRPDRLPLVIESMKLLIDQLGGNDRISIVTYAGKEQILADSIPGSNHQELRSIVGGLRAGGSTAGARALRQAYALASKNFIEGGNNRIILATDGDFNVGESSVADLISLVETERDRGVFISVLGYGMGNLKDNMMESIANNGNGNYAYIDTLQEAKKVLVDEFDSTMFTIAKDVKFQVEFNPETIGSYRLIGYDTRRLNNEDFNDDTKDAGEVGSGHSVTAFYELIPAGNASVEGLVDPLRYSESVSTGSDDLMTVKVRYKAPTGSESRLVEHAVEAGALKKGVSDSFVFASAIAEFGLIVTDSSFKGNSSITNVLSRANMSIGDDSFGLRAEFLDLVGKYGRMVGY